MSSSTNNSGGPANTTDSTAETAHKPIITTTNTYHGSGVGAGGSDGGNASGASPGLKTDIDHKSSTQTNETKS